MISGVLEASQVEWHVKKNYERKAHAGDESGALLELAIVTTPLLARVGPERAMVAEEWCWFSDLENEDFQEPENFNLLFDVTFWWKLVYLSILKTRFTFVIYDPRSTRSCQRKQVLCFLIRIIELTTSWSAILSLNIFFSKKITTLRFGTLLRVWVRDHIWSNKGNKHWLFVVGTLVVSVRKKSDLNYFKVVFGNGEEKTRGCEFRWFVWSDAEPVQRNPGHVAFTLIRLQWYQIRTI